MNALVGLGKTIRMMQGIIPGAGAGGGGGGGVAQDKPDPKSKAVIKAIINTPKSIMRMAGKGVGLAGVSLSVGSLLKQSQLFTGIMGSLFQVIGAFVDVLLAPFMPYLAKVIGMLAEQIPKVAAFSQKVHDWLAENVFPIIAEWAGKLWDGLQKIWVPVKEMLDWAMALPWGDWLKTAWTEAKGWFDMLVGHLTDIFGIVKPLFMDVAKVLWEFLKTTVWPIVEALYGLLKVVIDKIWLPLWKIIFKLYALMWEYVVKPILKGLAWLLQDVPQLIDKFAVLLTNIFTFDWLKNGFAAIVQFLSKIVNGLADFGMFGKKPFAFMEGMGNSLDELLKNLKSPAGGGGRQELNISVSTTVDGMGSPPEQLKYDLMDQQSITSEKQIAIRTDTNALEPNVPI